MRFAGVAGRALRRAPCHRCGEVATQVCGVVSDKRLRGPYSPQEIVEPSVRQASVVARGKQANRMR
eukprot:261338-Lingulodinium_polyedra.AAC.1